MRLHGFVSKPEIQKLNRNSIYVFVNGRLIRDRIVQHSLTEAYRNIIPPTVHPVVLLFLEMPAGEVDVIEHKGRIATAAPWCTTSRPATRAQPEVGGSRVVSTSTVVDLPAPLGPRKP